MQSVWRAGFASERLEKIQALKPGTSGFQFQLCHLLWGTGKVTLVTQFLYLENGKSNNLSGHGWMQAIKRLAHSVRGDYHHHQLSELRPDVHFLQASPGTSSVLISTGGDGGELCLVKP